MTISNYWNFPLFRLGYMLVNDYIAVLVGE